MDAVEAVAGEVAGWEGVTRAPHARGGVELRLGPRELGHVHPDGVVDLAFHRRVRDMLVETGRAEPHRHLPDSGVGSTEPAQSGGGGSAGAGAGTGWVTFRIRRESDVAEAVALFRLAYERARVAQAVRHARGESA